MYFNLDLKEEINYELKNFINKEGQYTIPIFIPHKGCKNECVFCNQVKISGATKSVTLDEVDNIIKERLLCFRDKSKKVQIAFFGGSFTGIKISDQISYLKVANKYIKMGVVGSIRLSTRPDYINVRILKILKKYNVETIELGVQSMSNEVLESSKRGHTKQDVVRASRLIRLFGFRLGHQIMVGLPDSTKSKEEYTIKESLRLKPSDLRIYPVYVIHPSKLYDMYKNGEYLPLSIEDTVNRVCSIIKYCQKTDVKIIRLGLQSTDEITVSNKEIAGPVCDNITDYVASNLIRKVIKKRIDTCCNNMVFSKDNVNVILLDVPKKYVSFVIGPKKMNKIYLEEKYNKYNIKFKIKGEKYIEESNICI